MKTIENVTIYKCDFCKKELKRKHAMIKHEDLCLNNPKNHKACLSGCAFLTTEKIDVCFGKERDMYGNEIEIIKEVNAFVCTKLDNLMYPFSIERKKDMLKKYPETYEGQEPMPHKCEHFESMETTDVFEFLNL